MKKANHEKLIEYLEDLKELPRSSFPIGLIIFLKKDRPELEKIINKEKITYLKIGPQPEDEILEAVVNNIKNKKGTALEMAEELPGKIFNQLQNMAEGSINVHLAGHKEPTIINPIAGKGFLVLLVEKEFYREIELRDTVSSYCNLTK